MASSPSPPSLPRRIAHFDLDTFFVAVARVLDPSLVGKPVLIGYRGPRGVVATASYEARAFGCHSAQPMSQALRLCPQALVVAPDFEHYVTASRAFHEILRSVTPLVESAGLDEAYTDLTGLGEHGTGALDAAHEVRRRVRDEIGIAVSVCVAGSRTTAKVGSDRAKPDGCLEVPVGGDAAFLAPLPIRDLPLVGPKLAEALAPAGIRTIGDAAAADPRWLAAAYGRAGAMLADRSRGIDPTPVNGEARERKQISREITFGVDIEEMSQLHAVLRRHADLVGEDLRARGKRARTITLKVRWTDFTTVTRSRTLERPASATRELVEAANALLDEVVRTEGMRPVRLLGLGVMNLTEDVVQLGLGERAEATFRDDRLDRAIDALRVRFGDKVLHRGAESDRSRREFLR